MKANDQWHDPRPTEVIIAAILANPTRDSEGYVDDPYWSNVQILRHRVTRDVWECAARLCASDCVVEQRLGCDILGQLGAPAGPFVPESVPVVLDTLARAKDSETIDAAIVALGFLGDCRAAGPVLGFADHSDPAVRWAVAYSLPRFAVDAQVIPALIQLSRDPDPEVRDWATFGLASQTDEDGPVIRDALWERTRDPEPIVRAEALSGLARRKAPGVFEALAGEIEREQVESPVVEAAEELPSPQRAIILERLRTRFPDWDEVTKALARLRAE
jgi:HEAT repeats